MLRSLDPRFACVTIPYWDFFADYAKRQNGLCTTFQGCASILSDLGGSSGAPSSTVTINGVPVSGTCVSNGYLSNFCQSSTMWGDQCAKCLPRDNWLAKAFPSGFGYASLARILTISPGFSFFSQNIHYGIHNSIHNTAGSTMATLLCASDPLFFSHQ
jgi:tyrosinase